MTDEEIPENVDLRFLAEQLKRVIEQTKLIPQLAKDVSELQVTVAAMRTDQGRANETLEHHSGLLEKLADTQANQGYRLNAKERAGALAASGPCRDLASYCFVEASRMR